MGYTDVYGDVYEGDSGSGGGTGGTGPYVPGTGLIPHAGEEPARRPPTFPYFARRYPGRVFGPLRPGRE